MDAKESLISAERIERLIFHIRGQKVMLDADLARIYGVTTTRLNQQVKRNHDRFPEDFMFQLTREEFDRLMLQNATSKRRRGGRRTVVSSQGGKMVILKGLMTLTALNLLVWPTLVLRYIKFVVLI